MRGAKIKKINRIARELAASENGSHLGYYKIRKILKKASPKSRQRWYQVKHKILGLCARCDRVLAVNNAEHCKYHRDSVEKAVMARKKARALKAGGEMA